MYVSRAVIRIACIVSPLGQLAVSQAPERCTLSATVVNAATNAGITRALVSYNGPASGFRFSDAGGNIHVDDVPCASYTLNVSKPGFTSGSESPAPLNQAGAILPLETEESASPLAPTIQGVDLKPGSLPATVRLLPVSSIAGTVIDENAEPLQGVTVQAIAVRASLSGLEYVPVKMAHTDDRGHYALFDLKPGEYVVRLAGEASSTRYFVGSRLALNNDHRGLQPVYYPNADSTAAALVLNLLPGQETSADFRQTSESAVDINGHLTGLIPTAYTQIQLYHDGDRLPVARAFVNLSTGQFRVIDVPQVLTPFVPSNIRPILHFGPQPKCLLWWDRNQSSILRWSYPVAPIFRSRFRTKPAPRLVPLLTCNSGPNIQVLICGRSS